VLERLGVDASGLPLPDVRNSRGEVVGTLRIVPPAAGCAGRKIIEDRLSTPFPNREGVYTMRRLEGSEPGRRGPGSIRSEGLSPSTARLKARSMLSVDIALPDVDELHKLVEQGQEKGFLTYDEITKSLEDVDLTNKQLEEFTTYLIDHSIELVEGEQHKTLPHEQPIVPPEEAATPKLA
jgi:hypothetical protein